MRQALGEKYGLLPGYEEEEGGKKKAREPKHKGLGKKTLQLAPNKGQQQEEQETTQLKEVSYSVAYTKTNW